MKAWEVRRFGRTSGLHSIAETCQRILHRELAWQSIPAGARTYEKGRLVQIVDDTASSEETYTLFHASEKVSNVVADWLSSENDDMPKVDAREGSVPEVGLKIPE